MSAPPIRPRVEQTHIDQWRRDRVVVVPDFFSPAELAPVQAEYERLHPKDPVMSDAEPPRRVGEGGRIGHFDPSQFANILPYPFAANLAMNLLPLHPALIDTARRMLGVDAVFMYQCHTWAKFTGAADYDQEFHFDFGNHTLLVPPDECGFGTVNYVTQCRYWPRTTAT